MNESRKLHTYMNEDRHKNYILCDFVYDFLKKQNYSDSTSVVATGWGYEKETDCKGKPKCST